MDSNYSLSRATAVPRMSSRGHERAIKGWGQGLWGKGWKPQGGERASGRGRSTLRLSQSRFGALAAFPDEFVASPSSQSRFMLVSAGKNRFTNSSALRERGDPVPCPFPAPLQNFGVPTPTWGTLRAPALHSSSSRELLASPSPVSTTHGDPSVPASWLLKMIFLPVTPETG